MEAQAVATQLMIELCGATRRAGHDRRRRRRARAGDDPPARRARSRACSARRSRASAASEILDALGFTATRGAGRPRRHRAALPPRRRHARGRPDRGGRAARRAREAARRRPARHAAAGAAPGRPPDPAQRLRRRASDALAAQGLHEIVGWSFDAPELRGGAAASRATGGARAREPDVGRAVAAAHDAARLAARRRATQPLAAGRRRFALFEAGAVYLARRRRRASCRPSPTISARCSPGRCGPPDLARSPPRAAPTSSPPRACSRGVLERAARRLERRAAATEPFLHPGRCAAVLVGGETVGWLGELHPQVAAEWDLDRDGRRRSSSTSTRSPEPCSRRSTRTLAASRRSVRTWRSSSPSGSAPQRC